jgi:uncharacterized membrane protein YraQ (UPF0718 family)
MTSSTVILWVIALILAVVAWRRGEDTLRSGVELGWQTLKRNLFLMIVAFIIVGYVNVLSPQDLVETLLGPETGWRGILLAEGVGMLLPGGPYVVFPLIAALYSAGAGLGAAVTLVTSWAMLALLTVTFELPFMGWRFTVVRWGLGLLAPLLAGIAAQFLFG